MKPLCDFFFEADVKDMGPDMVCFSDESIGE